MRGRSYEFLGSALKIDVGHGYRYPDGFVACTPEIGIELPLAEFYEGVDLAGAGPEESR